MPITPNFKREADKVRALWVEERRLFDLRTTGRPGTWGRGLMPRWDGGDSANGKHYKNVWVEIVKWAHERNMNTAILVRAMFFYAMLGVPPKPNQAMGVLGADRYDKYTSTRNKSEYKTTLLSKFESQKTVATSSVDRLMLYNNKDVETAWRLTITNNQEPLTPLFRYCAAKRRQWQDLAQLFEVDARYQYDRDKDLYDEVWGDWIPAELKEAKNEG